MTRDNIIDDFTDAVCPATLNPARGSVTVFEVSQEGAGSNRHIGENFCW